MGAVDGGSQRDLAAIDALLARSEMVIAAAKAPGRNKERDRLVYEPDWDEGTWLTEWRALLSEIEGPPPVLLGVIALDAWNTLAVLQPRAVARPAAGYCYPAPVGLTSGGHLCTFNLGFKAVPVERRRHRDRNSRLLAILHGLGAAAEQGLKEHDRLTLARTVMERRLVGRRMSSKLPGLIDLVLARPLVSVEMVAKVLAVTPQAALRIVRELGLRRADREEEFSGVGHCLSESPWARRFERFAMLGQVTTMR